MADLDYCPDCEIIVEGHVVDEDTTQAAWYGQEMQEYRRKQEEWDELYEQCKQEWKEMEERLWRNRAS